MHSHWSAHDLYFWWFFPIVTDRYVILGNHRDAWNFGAVDASSGTSSMMEVARIMGEMVKKKGGFYVHVDTNSIIECSFW